MKHGKKYSDSLKLIDHLKQYDPEEAVDLVVKTGKAKFDETVEISVRLGVDPRHADQQVRGAVVLPHGTGRTIRVLVIAKGDKAKEAEEAGADYVGAEEMIQKIQQENWFEFDVCVATPDMMGMVGRTVVCWARRASCPTRRAVPLRWISPRPSKTSKPVKWNTVWTRPLLSTARSARFPSARKNCRRT